MIIDQRNAAVNLHTLAHIHFNGVFIAVIVTPDRRINLFYWNRFLVEIHCESESQQWIPRKITYVLKTDTYMESLKSDLTEREFRRLQDLIRSQEAN